MEFTGTVTGIKFRNEENGWTVLRIKGDDGDTTELGFNDWGYQAFLKIDLSKYKKPVVAFNFLDISDTEDFVGTVTIGTSDKVGGSGKNTYDLKYSEFHGKRNST